MAHAERAPAHCYELGCCNAYQAQGASQTSVPIPLLAGQAYYIEGLYKENTGGDYYRVVARLDGQPVRPPPVITCLIPK
jgi:hypothetical protein